jgi:isopenicillin N synthase-like dioxygenase
MATFDTIDCIDLEAYLVNDPGALSAVAMRVRRACLDVGFFQVTGHGLDPKLVEGAFEASRRFHARPTEEKLRVKLNRWHRGYEPFASGQFKSAARFEPAAHPNQLESFFVRHEVEPGTQGYKLNGLLGPNRWPDDPEFYGVVKAYDRAITELGLALLPAMSVAVGEAPEFFASFFSPPSTGLRLIHYPALAPEQSSDTLGIGAHTDYGFLTLLAQDEIGGLEVRGVDGSWNQVPPKPGALVVNIGDVMARWTNDVFNSTPHRVRVNTSGRDRYSIAMFFDPNVKSEIQCIDAFLDAAPASHPSIRYGDYFQMRLDANFPERG